MDFELGVVGAGNMAEAIARGVIAAKVMPPTAIIASDVSAERRAVFQAMGVNTTEDNAELARRSPTILLSVKPQQMASVLAAIAPALHPRTLVISIAAGISTRFIENALGSTAQWRVIRTMPNTPMLVGEGMVGLCAGAHATADDIAQARAIFQSAATVLQVDESKIDAVTAISGSGPAYFFYLVEQMIRAGQELGLTEHEARTLAVKTASGAARMLLTSSDSPQELRRKVTSPGGTTHAAVSHLDGAQVGNHLVEAFKSAARRSKELGQ